VTNYFNELFALQIENEDCFKDLVVQMSTQKAAKPKNTITEAIGISQSAKQNKNKKPK